MNIGLFTDRVFRYSSYINYFGDVILFAGWAATTGAWWNMSVPISMDLNFYSDHIQKESYLAQKYSENDWPRYIWRRSTAKVGQVSRSTKALIPYVLLISLSYVIYVDECEECRALNATNVEHDEWWSSFDEMW